jgi:ATP-binding protein involved in chromosome partitioning
MPAPIEIVGLGKPEVRLVWDEGDEDLWTARDLRLRCTCAHCVHEFSGDKLLDPATVSDAIVVSTMNLVGNYGISIGFSDGHSTGIYRFDELYQNRPPKR